MDGPEYIEPSFDLRKLREKLMDPKLSDNAKAKLLMGLHYKMWHLPAAEMKRLLKNGNYGDSHRLVDKVIRSCPECRRFASTMTKPVASGGTLGTFFNERVQTDLFHALVSDVHLSLRRSHPLVPLRQPR